MKGSEYCEGVGGVALEAEDWEGRVSSVTDVGEVEIVR
jgi:hypothetical protein